MLPLEPETVAPVLTETDPLTPTVPAIGDSRRIDPLAVSVDDPLRRESKPPVDVADKPLSI
jgi:hypothetical protein